MTRPRSKVSQQLYTDNWPRRRKWMLTILIWAIANAQYLIVWGHDTGLAQNALVTLLGLIGAVMGSYVFGAVWDDNDKRRRLHHFETEDDSDGSDQDPDPLPAPGTSNVQ